MINKAVTNTVLNELEKSRIVNIRIPSNESFVGLLLPKYNIFRYETAKNKLRRGKSRVSPILRLLAWLCKVGMFLIDCFICLGFSLLTITSLSFELIENGATFIKSDTDYDDRFFKALSKSHFKFRKKPAKTYKKLKNIICMYFEDEPIKETYNSILLLCELIDCKRMVDTAVVIISKTKLNTPPQCIVNIEDNAIDNAFIYDFSRELLESIRQEQYETAAVLISKILNERKIIDPIKFEFVLQCLAFCYRKLNVNDFKEQFPNFEINKQLNTAREHKFISAYGADANFLTFCYEYFPKYYCNRSPIGSDTLDFTFKSIVQNIKTILDSNNEYYSAAKLFAKFATAEDAADNFIIAFLHNEFIKNTVNDECYHAIESYADTANRAKLFLELYEQNAQSSPNANKVIAIIETIEENGTNAILRLCFYYYAVNAIYKNDCCTNTFLKKYIEAYNELDDSESIKCIFGAQFLLLYTTIEDRDIRKNMDKSVSLMLDYVLKRSELLADKKTYVKICRSLNGLRVDRFNENLAQMESIKQIVEHLFVSERVYYYLNLGATYAFRSDADKSDYSVAIKNYGKISYINKNYPLCIQATYFNNITVFKYLNSPSSDMASKCFDKLANYAKKYYGSNEFPEERRHMAVNLCIFAILSGQSDEAVNDLFKNAETIIESDNYFKFYLDQAKLLYSALRSIPMSKEAAAESVFFIHKKSFFEQKRKVMLQVAEKGGTTIEHLNSTLEEKLQAFTQDYNYFKRADLFSLIERWYE